MAIEVVSHASHPEYGAVWMTVVRDVWPEHMLHDAIVNALWDELYERFPHFQLYLVDPERAADGTRGLVGVGNAAPIAWDGMAGGLPAGFDAVLQAAVFGDEAGVLPTALSALQAAILPPYQRAGLSTVVLGAMRDLARGQGFSSLVAPVRPTFKSRYPLTPMERYVRWCRSDGLPFDPWLRVHARLGAEIVRVAYPSMAIRGTVAEWEAWTGLAFPESGQYVVDGALAPVEIDRERDLGEYVEANVWMHHKL